MAEIEDNRRRRQRKPERRGETRRFRYRSPQVLTPAEEALLLDLLIEAEASSEQGRGEKRPFSPYTVLGAMREAGVVYWRMRRRQKRALSASHEQRRKRLLALADRATDTRHAVTSINVVEVYRLLGADRQAGRIPEIDRMHELPRPELKAFLEQCAAALGGLYPPLGKDQPHLDPCVQRFACAVREAVKEFTHIDVSQPAESLNASPRHQGRRDDPADWGPLQRFVRAALHIVDPGLSGDLGLVQALRRCGNRAFELP